MLGADVTPPRLEGGGRPRRRLLGVREDSSYVRASRGRLGAQTEPKDAGWRPPLGSRGRRPGARGLSGGAQVGVSTSGSRGRWEAWRVGGSAGGANFWKPSGGSPFPPCLSSASLLLRSSLLPDACPAAEETDLPVPRVSCTAPSLPPSCPSSRHHVTAEPRAVEVTLAWGLTTLNV